MNRLKQKALLCLLLLPTKESSQPALHYAFSYFYEPTHVYVHTHTHTHTRTHTQSTNCKSTLGDWLQGYRAPYARSVHILESKTPRTHLKEKNTGIWWFSGTHTEALTFHAYGRLKSNWKPSAGRGALLQGDSSPRRCSEQPLYAYWHHQERLGGRGYYGNQAMCWETEAFNCFNNFLGLELPGLGLLSRGWRLSQKRLMRHGARGLSTNSGSLHCNVTFEWQMPCHDPMSNIHLTAEALLESQVNK